MKVINKTSFPVIAVCWHMQFGHGDEERIEPGQCSDVSGPYIGEMGDGSCYLAMPGEVTCHEGEDDDFGFHISEENQLNLGDGESGVTIRHHSNILVL